MHHRDFPSALNDFTMLHGSGLASIVHDEGARTLMLDMALSSGSNDSVGWFGVFTFYDVAFVEAQPTAGALQALIASPDVDADVSKAGFHADEDGGVVVWAGSIKTHLKPPPRSEYIFRFRTSGFTWVPDCTRPKPYPDDPDADAFWIWTF